MRKRMTIDMTQPAHQKVLRNLLRASALAMLCLGSWTAHATHLVGGEIFYTHLGGNNYLITGFDLWQHEWKVVEAA